MAKRFFALALAALLLGAAQQPAAPDAPSPIRFNQLGFLPDGPKRALVPDPAASPLRWELRDAAGAVRARGGTEVLGDDAASGEHLHLIDFSSFTGAGEGWRLVVGETRSRPFPIAADIYARLPFDALAYFYHNRASVPIEARFAGGARWARPAAHAPDRATCFSGRGTDGRDWPGCSYTLDVSRGWYDAGDHGKYVVNGGISVWTLMNVWERRDTVFPDGSAAIPEAGNGVSDLLDEARFEMEFMLAMQVPEGPLAGMAHHKVADENWTAVPTPPHLDRERRFLYPPTTAATLNLAATAAQCARIWRGIDAAFSARCLAAARRAYAAAKANPAIHAGNFNGSGSYGDREVGDESYWAAAELFVTTGEAAYGADLRASPHFRGVATEPGWPSTATLGTISLALVPNNLSRRERRAQRSRIVAAADGFLAEGRLEGYRIPYGAPCGPQTPAPQGAAPQAPASHCYPWGSNSNLLNRAILLALAADFTGDPRYRAGVIDAMDYLLGRNPLDRSYVSGYGARPMAHPHHRFWAHGVDPNLPPPPPGALSGGPNSTSRRADPVGRELGDCAPQACWRDDIRAYALNEVAVNWNAPLVWVAAWLAERR